MTIYDGCWISLEWSCSGQQFGYSGIDFKTNWHKRVQRSEIVFNAQVPSKHLKGLGHTLILKVMI
jgi:hypothetical protein